ncbi:MinD/ParA family protein [Microbacterium esteraromaticum]|uniref:MinD/ParA family protein n=2 Tax=Microbacterium esteraromaticum TaxID=57043 RepID=A0A939DY42_9MICO|nr:MinD/ParA family protein [Microbacterium esteraromaticum]MBN8206479.1 MinD/ParA family protein [Microbacterium esteraromaticum]MBN8416634.1 MinD/ParA family protein [Microbacterium esteraromaticum]
MLDDAPSSDIAGIGLPGATAQVSVSVPTGADDDDLVDDEVIDGEIAAPEVVSELILDTSAVADADTVARIEQQAPDIVIELPAEQLAPPALDPVEQIDAVVSDESADASDARIDEAPVDGPAAPETAEIVIDTEVDEETDAFESAETEADAAAEPADAPEADNTVDADEDASGDDAGNDDTDAGSDDAEGADDSTDRADDLDTSELARLESVVAAAKAQLHDAMTPQRVTATPSPAQNDARPLSVDPAEENTPVANEDRAAGTQPAAAVARVSEETRPAADITLASKRLDDLGEASRESADLLTADRLLEPSRIAKPEPEGTWSHLLYTLSGGRINVGDSRKARERKQLNARISAQMPGTARFVPVLSRKGGVGKTTVTALLGMALADARDDRVIAVDANPDRGTLAERVVGGHTKSVRDLVRAQHDIRGYHDISALVARDHTRLDVLASDADPRVSEAFGDSDYRDVATVAAQYYSLVLTDSGTGIVHAVMGATLDLADQLVIVSGLSVDEARLASETLTWLETNGHADLARRAIVVLNQSTPGAPLVRLSELESHFSTRAAHVLRIPYDPQIAGGGPIDFGSLQPATRQAAREVAAVLVEGLRTRGA